MFATVRFQILQLLVFDTYEILILHFVVQTNVGVAGRKIGITCGEGARKTDRHNIRKVQRPETVLRKYA
jgi:hypothetical protein